MIKTQMSMFDIGVEVDSDIQLNFTREFAEEWLKADQWCLDIETYGVRLQEDALNPFSGMVRLIQVSFNMGQSIGVYDVKTAPASFFKLLGVKMGDASIVMAHNAQFELQWLRHHYGIVGNNIFDTMIASQVLYAGIEVYRHSLKHCIDRELGIVLNKDEQLSDFGLPELSNAQLNYSANDVRYLHKLATVLMQKLIADGLRDTIEIEMGCLIPYAYMGLQGFPIDSETLDSVTKDYKDAYRTLSAPVFSALKVTAVSNSKELQKALSDYLETPITSTNKTELSQYANDPLVQNLLDCRTLDNYIGYLNRCKDATIDDAVRGNFRQCAPKGLGRATCGSDSESEASSTKKSKGIPGVNLHNPPNPSKGSPSIKALNLPPVRSFFRPKKGQSLLIFDFSAAHARVAAQVTQDQAFIDSYIDNVDCHAIVASKLSSLIGKQWSREDISKIRKQKNDDGAAATRLRNISKNIFYGWLNGAGKAKTLDTIKAGGLNNATQYDADMILQLLGSTFTGIKRFHDQTKRDLRTTNPMPGCKLQYARITAISGRKVYAPRYEAKEGNRGGCNPNEAYIANWMMVESDAKKRAMGLIWKKSRQNPEWGMQLANECHDEIDVLCNDEYKDVCAEFCWNAMNGSLGYWVTSIPAYEDEYDLKDCLAESWASK